MMLLSPNPLLVVALALAFAFAPVWASASTSCYWANGTQAGSNIVACSSASSSASLTQCCLYGEACLSNGLCFDAGRGTAYRGACTAPDWVTQNSSACPTFCSSWNKGWGWADLNFCGQLGGDHRYWCADDTASSVRCVSPLYAWPPSLDGGRVAVSELFTTTVFGAAPSARPTTATAAPAATTTAPAAQPTAAPGSDSGSGTTSSSLPLALGAGVGIPLGILAVGVLGYLFMRERRRRRRRGGAGEGPRVLAGYNEMDGSSPYVVENKDAPGAHAMYLYDAVAKTPVQLPSTPVRVEMWNSYGPRG